MDVKLSTVSSAIQEVMEAGEVITTEGRVYPVQPIRNLNGHALEQGKIHAGKMLAPILVGSRQRMRAGEQWAIETFASYKGWGWVFNMDPALMSHQLHPCTHYMLRRGTFFDKVWRVPSDCSRSKETGSTGSSATKDGPFLRVAAPPMSQKGAARTTTRTMLIEQQLRRALPLSAQPRARDAFESAAVLYQQLYADFSTLAFCPRWILARPRRGSMAADAVYRGNAMDEAALDEVAGGSLQPCALQKLRLTEENNTALRSRKSVASASQKSSPGSCAGWKLPVFTAKGLAAHLELLCEAGLVDAYPPLVEKFGAYVAQYEHTLMIKPGSNAKEVFTQGTDY
ncbi:unnamed protein product [Amoebophrya sp. A120]|nr:unnamed protein product [Amoebophrya sp. A120]|eukprot:GSA120T00023070001.1